MAASFDRRAWPPRLTDHLLAKPLQVVERAYGILHRPPDPSGVDTYLRVVAGGATYEDLRNIMLDRFVYHFTIHAE